MIFWIAYECWCMKKKSLLTHTTSNLLLHTYLVVFWKRKRKKEKLTSDLHIHNSNYNSETKPVLASKSRSQENKLLLTATSWMKNYKMNEKLQKSHFLFRGFLSKQSKDIEKTRETILCTSRVRSRLEILSRAFLKYYSPTITQNKSLVYGFCVL